MHERRLATFASALVLVVVAGLNVAYFAANQDFSLEGLGALLVVGGYTTGLRIQDKITRRNGGGQ